MQNKYPVTISDLKKETGLKTQRIERVLRKLEVKNIVQLESLPGVTYVRLLRHDFRFIGRKRQRKFVKHHISKGFKPEEDAADRDDMMFQ